MLCPPLSPAPIVEDWLDRHRRPVSLALHILGIPPVIVGVLLAPIYLFALSAPILALALGLFVGGYALQFLGHFLEGSVPGELAFLLRKWRRVPRVPAETPAGSAPGAIDVCIPRPVGSSEGAA